MYRIETDMKDYPSIPKLLDQFLGQECIALEKIDGSNIRCEWSKKTGWYKWGTRNHLFDKTDPHFGCCPEVFNNTLAEPLTKAIRDNYPKAESAVVFMEFLGPHSFAGLHDPKTLCVEHNDPKKLILFDINIHKRGFLDAKTFVKHFGHLESAKVIYTGKLTQEFVKRVRENEFGLDEGVVAKGGIGPHKLWSCKIKTWDYLKKIQKYFGTSFGSYGE